MLYRVLYAPGGFIKKGTILKIDPKHIFKPINAEDKAVCIRENKSIPFTLFKVYVFMSWLEKIDFEQDFDVL